MSRDKKINKDKKTNQLMQVDIAETEDHVVIRCFRNVKSTCFPPGYVRTPEPSFRGHYTGTGKFKSLGIIALFSSSSKLYDNFGKRQVVLEVGVKYNRREFYERLVFIQRSGERLTSLRREEKIRKKVNLKTITI